MEHLRTTEIVIQGTSCQNIIESGKEYLYSVEKAIEQ